MLRKTLTYAAAAAGAVLISNTASAAKLKVTIENNAPAGGVYLTPVWVGFHDGSFDSYDGGSAASPELERLAEDGNTAPLSGLFAAPGRIDGTIGGGPIAPGDMVMATFNGVDTGDANHHFSYASMVLPSSDYFIANGDPEQFSLTSLVNVGDSISFHIGASVNDAGTEVNDFATSAGNGLFPQLNLPAGQLGPDEGADQNGVVANVAGIPFGGFLNDPSDLDTNAAAALIKFMDSGLYPNGIATVTIEVVPEPGAAALVAIGAAGLMPWRRRKA